MQESEQFGFVFPTQTPERGLSSTPVYDRGLTTPTSPLCRAESASCGRWRGESSGLARHHDSPCSACTSVALFVRLCWFPTEGGGGRSEVSGTAVCQSWYGT